VFLQTHRFSLFIHFKLSRFKLIDHGQWKSAEAPSVELGKTVGAFRMERVPQRDICQGGSRGNRLARGSIETAAEVGSGGMPFGLDLRDSSQEIQ
jgi:hypothetical protein